MKSYGVGTIAVVLAAGAGWALDAPVAASAPNPGSSMPDLRIFLGEAAPSAGGTLAGLPRDPEAGFHRALTEFSGSALPARMNAALLAARADWALLSTAEKETLHPFFHPPVERLGLFADARYEIRFPRGFGAARVAQAAMTLDGVRAAVAEHLPSLAGHADGTLVRAALAPFPSGAALDGYAALSGAGAFAAVNANLPPERLRSELFHQGAYALLLSAAPVAEPWLVEATALWLARKAGIEDYVSRIEPPTDATFAAGVGARPLAFPADPSFLFYLDSGLKNASLIDALWARVAGGEPFRDALRAALEDGGFAPDDVVSQFSLWTLHRGARSTKDIFPEGAAWPEFVPSARAEGAPFAFSGDGGAPWGFVAVAAGGSRPMRLAFEGRGGRFAAQALLNDAKSGGEWVSLNVNGAGDGALALPGGVAADAARAEERDGGVRVSWTTLTEDNVAGWLVWRVMPNGHHVLLTPIPVPSPGDSLSPMHYTWFDLVPRYHAGTYRYFVEAVTRDGLTGRFEAGSVLVSTPRGATR